MAQVAHPNGDGTIEVEVIDRETHGDEYVQIQAVEDGVSLTDQSDNPPWVEEDEVFESEDEQSESRVEAEKLE